ncbi:MAG: mechanosensitive ion channel family protein [Acholeplasmataceae bacterium]|nr:mechanosensitive ion channel family protein [Acholeplasmataceae bacterium]
MLNLILMNAITVNTLITIGIVIGLFLFFFIERKIINHFEDNLERWFITVIYILSFFVLSAGLIAILSTWNYDLISLVNTSWDNFQENLEVSMGRIISSLIILFIGLIILRIARITFSHIGKKDGPMHKRKKTIAKVSNSIVKYLVWIIMFLIILAVWGVNVAPALAGLGIAGLVIGLGAQKFINDLIAGIFIIFERHFDVGDIVEIQGFKGEVIDIGLKTTRLKNWKGDIKVVANGEITTVINYTEDFSVAVVEFGISYGADINHTISILNERLPIVMASYEEIIEKPAVIGVTNLNSSSVDLRVTAKTIQEKHYAVERELRKQIKMILDENHIEIPFPQVVIHQSK